MSVNFILKPQSIIYEESLTLASFQIYLTESKQNLHKWMEVQLRWVILIGSLVLRITLLQQKVSSTNVVTCKPTAISPFRFSNNLSLLCYQKQQLFVYKIYNGDPCCWKSVGILSFWFNTTDVWSKFFIQTDLFSILGGIIVEFWYLDELKEPQPLKLMKQKSWSEVISA